MLNSLLIPIDDSSLVRKMIKKLPSILDISNKTIYLLHVSEPFYAPIYSESGISEYYVNENTHKNMCEKFSKIIFDKYQKTLDVAEKIQVIHLYDSNIPNAILAAAKKHKVDGIVMASHRYKGIENVLLGDKAHKVIVSSKLPVLIL